MKIRNGATASDQMEVQAGRTQAPELRMLSPGFFTDGFSRWSSASHATAGGGASGPPRSGQPRQELLADINLHLIKTRNQTPAAGWDITKRGQDLIPAYRRGDLRSALERRRLMKDARPYCFGWRCQRRADVLNCCRTQFNRLHLNQISTFRAPKHFTSTSALTFYRGRRKELLSSDSQSFLYFYLISHTGGSLASIAERLLS